MERWFFIFNISYRESCFIEVRWRSGRVFYILVEGFRVLYREAEVVLGSIRCVFGLLCYWLLFWKVVFVKVLRLRLVL